MDTCSLCHGNSGWHSRAKKQLIESAERELKAAEGELSSLKLLFRELLWFNFEIINQTWNVPWRTNNPRPDMDTQLCIHGYHLTEHRHRGRSTYSVEHPIYWVGCVADATPIPPTLLYRDILDATAYVEYLRDRAHDAELYAPGGEAYEKLRSETQVGRNSNGNRKHAI